MEAFHNSRDIAYRSPYGAIAPGTAVTLAIDVLDAKNARVTLRTWLDDEGERLYEMTPVEVAPSELGPTKAGETCEGDAKRWEQAVRYQTTITPETAEIMWYHFIVSDEQGNTKRYGTTAGRVGGTGQLFDWEPPSFQLTVHKAHDLPPAWQEFANAYLRNQDAVHTRRNRRDDARELPHRRL